MKYCQNCGKELFDEAVICPGCGCKTEINDDSVSAGLVVLSVFIPLFGIIYWPVNARNRPRTAKACGIAAIVSWACSILISVISTIIVYAPYIF